MPDSWPVFFRGRKPNPVQEKAMPLLIRGESALLSGPTASGKTEAAVAPLFQRHVSFHRKEISVVYVAPTKALVNDLYHRLDSYLCARAPGAVRRYTGDRHEFSDPENVVFLLATPEALDSLQLVKPESLAGVRAVVIDEIHLLHGAPRGQQLRHVIDRIQKSARKPQNPKDVFQKIGMTATVKDMDDIRAVWLGENATTVRAGELREMEMTYLPVPVSDFSNKNRVAADTLAHWLRKSGNSKVLVFCNTRNGSQVLAAKLHEKLDGSRWPIHWHTGVLTAAERERVEDAMKNERFGVCVATSTLEVGIDIGDIDAVVLADPPFSVNAFLQRIGRGNRKTDVCKVAALCATKQELALFQALQHCATNGNLDDIHDYDRPSVRFQQIAGFAWKSARLDKNPLTKARFSNNHIDKDHLPVLEDMISTGAMEYIRGALVLSDPLMDQGDRRQFHTTIAGTPTANVIDGSTGDTVVSAGGGGITEGAIFVGGKMRQIVSRVDGSLTLEPVKGKKTPLATLPATRGKRGLSRVIVWALGEIAGHDPRIWTRNGNRLTTWGGADYNRLLAAILAQNRIAGQAKADEYGLENVPAHQVVTPEKVLEWTLPIMDTRSLPSDVASGFCDRSRYFRLLGHDMQEEEIQRSVPFAGFVSWLEECAAARKIKS